MRNPQPCNISSLWVVRGCLTSSSINQSAIDTSMPIDCFACEMFYLLQAYLSCALYNSSSVTHLHSVWCTQKFLINKKWNKKLQFTLIPTPFSVIAFWPRESTQNSNYQSITQREMIQYWLKFATTTQTSASHQ